MRWIIRLLFTLIVGGLIVAGAVAYWSYKDLRAPGPSTADTTVVIQSGTSVNGIARQLEEARVIRDARTFGLRARFLPEGQSLKAGEYRFPAAISAEAAMQKMIAGDVVQYSVTIPEGLTSVQILARIAAAPDLEGSVPTAPPSEGSLLPETYQFNRGDTRAEIVARMTQAMDDTMAELWPKRAKDLPLATPQEAIILASIVEKETGLAAERPRVAAVFVNRLRQGIPLQSDPTIIYFLTGGTGPLDRGLTFADLDKPDPYNTYLNAGLPPGPIANPGRASLEAVLNPPSTKELYFVADGTGGHAFAETLEQHNKNVANWRKIQKEKKDGAAGSGTEN
ncbi:MAG: endolytic transglycosylase MltG [Dongiaceae bacterium]